MLPRDDDFVLTISDNDEDVGLSEEEKEFERPAPASKKRKRNEDTQTSKTKSAKKPKKGKIAAPIGEVEDQDNDSASDTQDWTTKGEDDGALDSDFEFQVDENTGVEEDFDGWTSGAKKSSAVPQSAPSTKTAVN